MTTVFNIDKAELVSIFVEALLYGQSDSFYPFVSGMEWLTRLSGIFVVLFIAAVWILLFRRSTDRVNMPMLIAAILMFVFATTVSTLHSFLLCLSLMCYLHFPLYAPHSI